MGVGVVLYPFQHGTTDQEESTNTVCPLPVPSIAEWKHFQSPAEPCKQYRRAEQRSWSIQTEAGVTL